MSVSGSDAKADKFALGYVHNLSKRTALYTTFAYLKNKDGSDLALNSSETGFGRSSKGLDLGLRLWSATTSTEELSEHRRQT